jgi:hypothetical protein
LAHSSQASQRAAAEESEEECFKLVLANVRGNDEFEPMSASCFHQQGVAMIAQSFFGTTICGQTAWADCLQCEGNAYLLTEILAKVRIGVGVFAPETVIDMAGN